MTILWTSNNWRKLVIASMTLFLLCMYFGSSPLSISALGFAGMPSDDLETFASHATNNTVIIVPVNAGMLHWAENLLCSLFTTSFNTSQIVFWALDESVESTLHHKGFATYRDPSLFGTSNNENYRGGTPAYRRMMKERPKFFINILSAGFDILMLDADTIFWESPLLLIPGTDDGRSRSVDIVFSTDAREFFQTHDAFKDARRRGSKMPPVCNGIFWMKSSDRTIALWSQMLDVFNAPGLLGWYRRRRFQDDQRGMDVLLNDGRAHIVGPLPNGISKDMTPINFRGEEALNVKLLDQTLVVNGHLLRNRHDTYQENLARNRGMGLERIAAHFNWDTKDATKEEGAAALGMYLLDERGNCRVRM